MKVLVFGASGVIGFPVAQALLRAGHIVYGQTRSADTAKTLAAQEIIPVVGDPADTSSWQHLIGTIDGVVEALAGQDLKGQSLAVLTAVTEAAQKLRPADAPKITFVYTGGTWVHGDNRKEIVSDTTPISSPLSLIAWRPIFEQTVVTNTVVNGVVIRPSMVLCRTGSLFSLMFKSAYDGKATWYGKPGARIAIIHQDDLADLYVRVLENSPITKGLIFDASNDYTESADDILARLTEVSGAKEPYEFKTPSNPFEEAVASTALVRPYLGRALLGWQPRKPSLADNIEIYYNTWKANAGLQ